MFDLMIENGLIVDGTGNPGIFGTVGVKDNTVSILKGDTSSMQAGTRVDAAGKVVCPGFIDVHAHSALMIHQRHRLSEEEGSTPTTCRRYTRVSPPSSSGSTATPTPLLPTQRTCVG